MVTVSPTQKKIKKKVNNFFYNDIMFIFVKQLKQINTMTNLLNDFMSMELGIKLIFIFWGFCVLSFYSVLTYSIGLVLFGNLKKTLTNG